MQHIGNVTKVIEDLKKNKNLYFLIKNRFDWMNNFIELNKSGIEVGAAAGFSKIFTKNKSILITDFCDDAHLTIPPLLLIPLLIIISQFSSPGIVYKTYLPESIFLPKISKGSEKNNLAGLFILVFHSFP